jgi:hypothetical protein
MRHGLGAGCALLIGLSALLASVAHASCSCSAPSPPDPATETAAKIVVAGGVLAFVGYRYLKQKDGGR